MKRKEVRFLILLFLFVGIGFSLISCKKKEEEVPKDEGKEEIKEEVTVDVPPMSVDGVIYAVLVSKENKNLVLQTDAGKTIRLPFDEKNNKAEIEEELATGASLRIEYSGNLKNKKKKKLKIEKILPSDKLPKISKEALELCSNMILAFERRDLEGLSRLCDFPLIIDRGVSSRIGDEKAFVSLGKEEVFDGELGRQIMNLNPFMLEEYPQGFLIGRSAPNVMISNTKKGWKITAFHYK